MTGYGLGPVIVPAEWVHLTWASARKEGRPAQARYAQWIELHAVAEFEAFVGWLRAELDGIGPGLEPSRQDVLANRFGDVVNLEVAFFDQAYGQAKR